MNSLKAVILAAGEGKRLRPLTKNIPKCMVQLFGKSLLEWQIGAFQSCQINDISIVTGYCSHMINIPNMHYFKNSRFDTTNMVETLFCAKEKLTDSVIVSYGDIIFEKNVLQKLIDSTEDYSVVVDKNWAKYWKVRFENPLDDAESLVLDKNDYIINIGQKVQHRNEINGQYIGLMKFQGRGIEFLKNFYEKIKNEARLGSNPLNPLLPLEKSFMTDLLQGLIDHGQKLKSIQIENGWLELDTLHDYQIYEKMYSDHTLDRFISLGDMV